MIAALTTLRALPLAYVVRLRARLDAKIAPEPNTGCHLWLGAVNEPGYGNIGVAGRTRCAHRVAYLLEHAELAAELELDHLCRQPACCNPRHLEPVTHEENVRRGLLGVLHTSCIRGHDLTAEGALRPNGRCRACFNADQQKWRIASGRRAA